MNNVTFKDPKISDLVPFGNLVVEKAKHAKYEQTCGYTPVLKVLEENALVGIEIEVENMRNGCYPLFYWKTKEDNSLRNFGLELTSVPLRMHQVEYALCHLEQSLVENNKPDYSPRTSVHVHVNVRDMCWEQIKNFVLLYALFERHFFNIAGTKRETSVFCVPLYKTSMLNGLEQMSSGGAKWHKYSAINLGTILGNDDVPKFGTIEFRHLYGTHDRGTIIHWLNNIMCLRIASRQFRYQDLLDKIRNLNSTSEYYALYSAIFGEYADNFRMTKMDFEYCVSTTKLALWGKDWQKEFSTKLGSRFYTAYNTEKKDVMLKTLLKNPPPLVKTETVNPNNINWQIKPEGLNVFLDELPNDVVAKANF